MVFFYRMKAKIQNLFSKTKSSYKTLPEKKQYVEFFTAVLSVPVLLTVILLNINNLQAVKRVTSAEQKANPTPIKEIIYVSPNDSKKIVQSSNTSLDDADNTQPTPTIAACKKEVGPVSIQAPQENEKISENPVNLIIRYEAGDYCAVVWSYRINNGKWSEYDDKSIALYDLPEGIIHIAVKVKSIVTGDEKLLERNFNYAPAANVNEDKTSSTSAR